MTTHNEPNKARTIPLHIADQAVAACEAEIQKLKEENARLGHQVSNLMLQVNSPHPAVMRWSLACKERDALKDEVERLKENIDKLCKHGDLEIERLKEKSACQTECLDAFDKKLREAEAKIERLLEAGDEMTKHVGMEWAPSWVVEDWNDAKKNKPNA